MYADADEGIKAKARMEAEKTMDFQSTVQAVNAFRSERAAIEAARRAAEERAKAAEEASAKAEAPDAPAPSPAPATETAPVQEPVAEPAETEAPATSPKLYAVTIRFTGTKEQLHQLSDAIKSIGIAWEQA